MNANDLDYLEKKTYLVKLEMSLIPTNNFLWKDLCSLTSLGDQDAD